MTSAWLSNYPKKIEYFARVQFACRDTLDNHPVTTRDGIQWNGPFSLKALEDYLEEVQKTALPLVDGSLGVDVVVESREVYCVIQPKQFAGDSLQFKA